MMGPIQFVRICSSNASNELPLLQYGIDERPQVELTLPSLAADVISWLESCKVALVVVGGYLHLGT